LHSRSNRFEKFRERVRLARLLAQAIASGLSAGFVFEALRA
jgi:hypothetical protein